jgi:hypothetical protein
MRHVDAAETTARTFWRRLQVVVHAPEHAVVLPDGMTAVRLHVHGWGWLRVKSASAPRHVPVVRRFVRGPGATLDLTVPVGVCIVIVATNLWGRSRARFVVTPTHHGGPLLPAAARPRTVSATWAAPPHVQVPAIGPRVASQLGVDVAMLRPREPLSVPRTDLPFSAALSRLSSNLHRIVGRLGS